MKTYGLIFALLLVIPVITGRITRDSEGLYYNEQNELYTGTYSEYYDAGKLRPSMSIKSGVPVGDYVSYFENGQKHEQGFYKNGMFDGEWINWNKSGR